MAKLEVVYLMNVVKYFDKMDTLRLFIKVSKGCKDAVMRTKINPEYGMTTLSVAISNSRTKNAKAELKVFEGIETFYASYMTIEALGAEVLQNIPLVYVHKFVMQNSEEDYRVISEIVEKISRIGIDTSYYFDPGFDKMINLREISIRIGQNYKADILSSLFSALPKLNYLHKVVIQCDSNCLKDAMNRVKALHEKTQVIFIIDWLHQDDVEAVNEVVCGSYGTVGIVMINFDNFHDFFVKKNVVLIPFCPYNFQVSSKMVSDPRFNELLRMYLPIRIEIQGGIRPSVPSPESKVVDLSGCNFLYELFLNEARFNTRITLKLPKCLSRMFINNMESIECLDGVAETNLPQSIKDRFAENILRQN
ncbi:hypothetical protein EIN_026870 [Entamoeba invadens IP1]|uniref:hypothetical protein n=1 Tax=Entamoeba invadens IP1 TaxID=370355 RepID=UPI0002C3EABA|nr:hypothetical protein EIN_026870 [Entamoeba invadens IP1]ELP90808.1 hypothetical protein EIN_026870 [Entamoeba invadens IP1]|eukprot:XP_004257579.1 hypothetical protein EIN_026870 [Entamoeba invadens IP1]